MRELYCRVINDPELLIASIALITSIIFIIIGVVGLHIQRIHNKKSVLPLGTINLADYEDCLRIKISNNGVGPMILKSCITKGISESKPYPIDWMPDGIMWATFRKNLEEHAIIVGESLTLLELNIDLNDKPATEQRDKIRRILKDLELTIKYSDIYGKNFSKSRKLDWFGRNIE